MTRNGNKSYFFFSLISCCSKVWAWACLLVVAIALANATNTIVRINERLEIHSFWCEKKKQKIQTNKTRINHIFVFFFVSFCSIFQLHEFNCEFVCWYFLFVDVHSKIFMRQLSSEQLLSVHNWRIFAFCESCDFVHIL